MENLQGKQISKWNCIALIIVLRGPCSGNGVIWSNKPNCLAEFPSVTNVTNVKFQNVYGRA